MKNSAVYIISVLLSVLLVFAMIAGESLVIADISVTPDKLITVTEKNDVSGKVLSELERHFKERVNVTGVPVDVYMSALDEDYIQSCINAAIRADFDALENDGTPDADIPANVRLEENISTFFNDYADSTGYEKGADFDAKLSDTIDRTYSEIASYCDVCKGSTLAEHGVLSRLHKPYSRLAQLTAAGLICLAALLILLLAVNRKYKVCVLYWYGISAIIAGVLGIVPTAYLIASRYYDSFTIKQPQIFTVFTQSLYGLTRYMLAASIAMAAAGAVLTVIYAVVPKEKGNKTAENVKKI